VKRVGFDDFLKRASLVHNNKYDYSLIKCIERSTVKVNIICPNHGEFKQAAYAHMRGQGCPKCAIEKRLNNIKNSSNFIYKAKQKHGSTFCDYSQVKYVNNKTKVKIICSKHGCFFQTPTAHLKGFGCPSCVIENRAYRRMGKRRKNIITSRNTEDFIKEANKVHNYKYDYFDVIYKNAHTNIIIICKKHGSFQQSPNNHLRGSGCPKCSNIGVAKKLKKSIERFEAESTKIHNGFYDYSQVEYINNKTKVKIICSKHGCFFQTPVNHIVKKAGCPKCSAVLVGEITRKNTNWFIKEAKKVHKNTYTYNKTEYTFSNKKVKIICPKHGAFLQTPNHHLGGNGCPRCGHIVSKPSQDWLDLLKIPEKYREKTIELFSGKKYRVDAYDIENNVVYEFWGDFWHGNPEVYKEQDINPIIKVSFGELYKKTIKKKNDLIKNGYVVIDVWEKDFKEMEK